MNPKSSTSLTAWLPVAVLLTALLACNASQAGPSVTQVSGQNILPTAVSGQNNPPTAVSGQNNPPTAVSGQNDTPTSGQSQPANTETPTSTLIVHNLIPGEPPAGALSEITDRNSSEYAAQHRTNGGENFGANLYERPFNANTMDKYFPDLDIIRARLMRDDRWVFVSIYLVGPNPAGGMRGDYGVELDLNVDGRGDVLVMAAKPGAKWSTEGVRAWLDPNHDVGGAHPIQSDAPVNGDGYEKLVFDQGVGSDPDEAWARISPSDPNIVQIAFKRALINDDDSFTWGAWAMNASTLNPAWFDYNDHFTAAEAGSPLTELTAYYPIKAFAEVDNTCRWVVGFTPTGSEPGICPIPGTPTPSPTATSTPTSTRTPTPILPATITGLIWFDFNNDGVFNAPPDSGYPGVSVRVRSGNCGAPGGTVATVSTNPTGHYSVTVNAGTYCVDAPTMPISADHSSGPVTVTVNSGGTGNADVRFWLLITMR